MKEQNPILDDDKHNSYMAVLGGERRKKIPIYIVSYTFIVGLYLLGIFEKEVLSGVLVFLTLFFFYEITVSETLYHVASNEKNTTLYLLDILGKKIEIHLCEKKIQQIKLNHKFQSIVIPEYDLKLSIKEEHFKHLISIKRNNKLGSSAL
jgi:hypothetical protein